MPHLTLEYTGNLPGLDVQQALAALNAALLESGHFEGPDIKSRALRLTEYLVGDGSEAGAFAHVTLRLLSGRTSQVRATLASSLLAALCRYLRGELSASAQVSIEVIELDRSSYVKAQASRARRELASLEDRALADTGISAGERDADFHMSFWAV